MRVRITSLLPALGIAMTLAGCSDLGDSIKLTAHAELSANTLDFGTVAVSATANRSVTVTNSGNAPLSCNATVGCAVYLIVSGGGSFVLGPGEKRTVTVSFKPGGTGSFPCKLDLGPACPQVNLAGKGALQLPGAQCTLSTDTLVFASQSVGTSGFPQDFQVSSTGTDTLLVDIVSSPDFGITAGGGPARLAPGAVLTVTVEFHPTTGGTHRDSVVVGPGCPHVGVSGDGTTVSYANDIQGIFNTYGCIGCHGDGSNQVTGMLTSYGSFVNRTSFSYRPFKIVAPYDPANSVMPHKLKNDEPLVFGQLMPQGGPPISAVDLNAIITWITEGAHNN